MPLVNSGGSWSQRPLSVYQGHNQDWIGGNEPYSLS